MLIKLPDKRLRQKAVPATTKLDLTNITEEMSRVRQENGGIGLAAPQIGQSVRIINIVYRGKEYTIFNPYIQHKKGAVKMFEGCLSVDGVYQVTRPQTLTLFGTDSHGRPVKLKCKTPEESSVAEHEVDHLDGILIDKKGILVSPKVSTASEKGNLAFG
jgi:peptide deformylase